MDRTHKRNKVLILVHLGLEYSDVREFAVLAVKVEAVPHHELVLRARVPAERQSDARTDRLTDVLGLVWDRLCKARGTRVSFRNKTTTTVMTWLMKNTKIENTNTRGSVVA